MPYCMYLRKSRADMEAESRGEGETLARHQTALLDLAKRLRLNISQIYKEIVSGETIAARPVMQQVLTEVEQGAWDGVLVMEVERLARGDTIDQGIVAQSFKLANTKIITPSKTYDPNDEFDEEYFEFGLFMSRREYKTINRRLQRGRMASLNEGKFISSVAPYGYKRVKASGKGWTLEPDEKESQVVKDIFRWYNEGEVQPDGTYKNMGSYVIARLLDELGVSTRTGNKWAARTVTGILKNPVYTGKLKWGERKYEKQIDDGKLKAVRHRAKEYPTFKGLHEPLITEHDFKKAQSILSDFNPPPMPSNKKMQNPLTGLIICGKCGHKMTRQKYYRGNDSLLCGYAYCDMISSTIVVVEIGVMDALQKWLDEYKVEIERLRKDMGKDDLNAKKTAAERITAELDRIDKQMQKAYEFVEREIYTEEVFLKRMQELTNKKEELEESSKKLDEDLSQAGQNFKAYEEFIPRVQHVLDVYWRSKTPEEKNKLLKSVIDKVVYNKSTKSDRFGKETDLQLDIYPRLPD